MIDANTIVCDVTFGTEMSSMLCLGSALPTRGLVQVRHVSQRRRNYGYQSRACMALSRLLVSNYMF